MASRYLSWEEQQAARIRAIQQTMREEIQDRFNDWYDYYLTQIDKII